MNYVILYPLRYKQIIFNISRNLFKHSLFYLVLKPNLNRETATNNEKLDIVIYNIIDQIKPTNCSRLKRKRCVSKQQDLLYHYTQPRHKVSPLVITSDILSTITRRKHEYIPTHSTRGIWPQTVCRFVVVIKYEVQFQGTHHHSVRQLIIERLEIVNTQNTFMNK